MQHMVESVVKSWRALYPWLAELDDRECAEVALAIHYRDSFDHGTSGHLSYRVIAKLFDAAANNATEKRTQ